MSRETDFVSRMTADVTLMTIMTGGVYAYGSLGLEGLTRETVPAAFDANGYLKPAIVAKARPLIPDGEVYDADSQDTSARQIIELWFYQDSGYTSIDSGMARTFILFQGHRFSDTFPVEWAGTPVTRGRDEGTLKGRPMARQDWLVVDIQGD